MREFVKGKDKGESMSKPVPLSMVLESVDIRRRWGRRLFLAEHRLAQINDECAYACQQFLTEEDRSRVYQDVVRAIQQMIQARGNGKASGHGSVVDALVQLAGPDTGAGGHWLLKSISYNKSNPAYPLYQHADAGREAIYGAGTRLAAAGVDQQELGQRILEDPEVVQHLDALEGYYQRHMGGTE